MKNYDWRKHAIELVLVVVGILIALGIDSWNSDRKDRIHEHQLLVQIHQELQKDLDTVNSVLDRRSRTLASIDVMQAMAATGDYETGPAEASMVDILRLERIAFRRGAYEVLRFSGLRLSNSELRVSLSDYYEYSTPLAEQSVKDIEYSFITSWIPLAERLASKWQYGNLFEAKDPDTFFADERIVGLLVVERDNNNALLLRLQNLKLEIEQLISATQASYRKLAP